MNYIILYRLPYLIAYGDKPRPYISKGNSSSSIKMNADNLIPALFYTKLGILFAATAKPYELAL